VPTETRSYEKKARAEGERRTRERIIRATMELHEEVGPAKTTVAEIARRAGVQRLTVYNHFPEDTELFGACQAHWMGLHPLPDFAELLGRSEPDERLRNVLGALYAWYRETEPMAEKIYRDRGAIPALDQLVAQTADRNFAELAEALAAGFGARGARARRLRALIRLALDFWTWRRLDREGIGDAAAATLMAEAANAAAG
jgi:AcrR family transcriptional regulator